MKVLSAEEMRRTDLVTVERFGVASLDLMEHAGQSVAKFILAELPGRRRITVLCGKGNNGGDGFVAARHLTLAGCAVTVLVLGNPAEIHGDARAKLHELTTPPIGLAAENDIHQDWVREIFAGSELFIDAVVGTGFQPPLKGIAAKARDMVDQFPHIPVVAVDLPSGWDADSRSFLQPEAYRANAVVTFTAPKPAHIFGMLTGGQPAWPGSPLGGPIVVAPIGSPEEAIVSSETLRWAGDAKKAVDQPRRVDSNKGSFGHVLVLGGSRGKAGAPAMASIAALRAGAGLVTAAVPVSILPMVAGTTPELMTVPLLEGVRGEVSERNLDLNFLPALLEKISVVAVGPGMGTDPEAQKFFFGLLETCEVPMVIDADALNALSSDTARLKGEGRMLVLTPHPGEMSRLVGLSTAQIQQNREEIAREFNCSP
jgi:NAD(P)H-hydrate epimerase